MTVSNESKETTHRRFYEAFHAWFMQSPCDFWNECDAPELLASIAVELCDEHASELAREARAAAIEEAAQLADDLCVPIEDVAAIRALVSERGVEE